MLEKQFGFSSAEAGVLMSCNDIGFLCTVMFAGYLAKKVCKYIIGQRHAKRDLGTYAKSVDPDQPPRLRRSV